MFNSFNRKAPSLLFSLIKNVAAAYFGLVLLAAIFLAPFITYAWKSSLTIYNWFFVFVAICLGVLFFKCTNFFAAKKSFEFLKKDKLFLLISMVSSLVLICFQAFVVGSAWFVSGWDVGYLCVFDNPSFYYADIPEEEFALYFSVYPNQLFLAGIFFEVGRIASFFGIGNEYLCVVAISCLCVVLSLFFTSFVVKKLAGFRLGYSFLIFGSIIVGLSPWFMVPYSDTFGMFWTCLILFSYVCIDNKRAKWFLVSFALIIGYMIKPTVVFVGLSIFLVELFLFLKNRNNKTTISVSKPRQYFEIALAIVLGFCLAFAVSVKVKDIDIEINDEQSFSMTHYLMMGLNPDDLGAWSSADTTFSLYCPDKESRQQANIEVWKQRIKDYGVDGLLKLYVKKSLTVYADGTFAWEDEGNFYKETYGQNEIVKEFYGIDDVSEEIYRDATFAPAAQIFWFTCLIGLVCYFFRKNTSKQEIVMILSLLMLSVFLIIFECRARYILLYLPYFVALSLIGWNSINKRFLENKRIAS